MRPKGSAAQLEYRRHLGGKLLAQSKGLREVARLLEVAPSSVWRWQQALKRGGARALRAKPHPGPAPRLSRAQQARLVRKLAQGPRAAGYATGVWTCARVAAVIRQTFGVSYHPAHVWRLVRRLVGSPQKPKRRGRDAAVRRHWGTRTWPRLNRSAAASRSSEGG